MLLWSLKERQRCGAEDVATGFCGQADQRYYDTIYQERYLSAHLDPGAR
jgi:hypothetical protein